MTAPPWCSKVRVSAIPPGEVLEVGDVGLVVRVSVRALEGRKVGVGVGIELQRVAI